MDGELLAFKLLGELIGQKTPSKFVNPAYNPDTYNLQDPNTLPFRTPSLGTRLFHPEVANFIEQQNNAPFAAKTDAQNRSIGLKTTLAPLANQLPQGLARAAAVRLGYGSEGEFNRALEDVARRETGAPGILGKLGGVYDIGEARFKTGQQDVLHAIEAGKNSITNTLTGGLLGQVDKLLKTQDSKTATNLIDSIGELDRASRNNLLQSNKLDADLKILPEQTKNTLGSLAAQEQVRPSGVKATIASNEAEAANSLRQLAIKDDLDKISNLTADGNLIEAQSALDIAKAKQLMLPEQITTLQNNINAAKSQSVVNKGMTEQEVANLSLNRGTLANQALSNRVRSNFFELPSYAAKIGPDNTYTIGKTGFLTEQEQRLADMMPAVKPATIVDKKTGKSYTPPASIYVPKYNLEGSKIGGATPPATDRPASSTKTETAVKPKVESANVAPVDDTTFMARLNTSSVEQRRNALKAMTAELAKVIGLDKHPSMQYGSSPFYRDAGLLAYHALVDGEAGGFKREQIASAYEALSPEVRARINGKALATAGLLQEKKEERKILAPLPKQSSNPWE